MPQYTEKDFSRCFFNPLEKNLLKTYPALQELLPEGEIDERTIRFCLALYDPKSPVIRDNPDMTSRKNAAAEVAGFTAKDKERLDEVFACDDEVMREFIVSLKRNIISSRLWASIQADEQLFWEFINRLFKPISDDSDKEEVNAVEKKLRLSQGKEEISARIDENWAKFLGDDEDLKKKVKRQAFSPESMAGVK